MGEAMDDAAYESAGIRTNWERRASALLDAARRNVTNEEDRVARRLAETADEGWGDVWHLRESNSERKEN